MELEKTLNTLPHKIPFNRYKYFAPRRKWHTIKNLLKWVLMWSDRSGVLSCNERETLEQEDYSLTALQRGNLRYFEKYVLERQVVGLIF